MTAKADILKGRIEEAAGILTGNNKLCRKGRKDQTVGRAKQATQIADAKILKSMHK